LREARTLPVPGWKPRVRGYVFAPAFFDQALAPAETVIVSGRTYAPRGCAVIVVLAGWEAPAVEDRAHGFCTAACV